MSSELFKAMTETFIVHIPVRGSGAARAAMLANETQMLFDNVPPLLPHIRSGKVRALAVTSLTRMPVLPDVPTVDESGLKGYEVAAWFDTSTHPEIARVVAEAEAQARVQVPPIGSGRHSVPPVTGPATEPPPAADPA